MRDRLVAAFVGLTVLVVALYGVPRAYVVADLVTAREQVALNHSADLVAVLVSEKARDGAPVTAELLRHTVVPGQRIVFTPAAGPDVIAGGIHPGSASDLTAVRDLEGGGRVNLTQSGTRVADAVADALLPLVLLGLALIALAAVLGMLLARWLAAPFRQLADAARQLGAGHFDVAVPRHPVPEAEAIGTALQDSARRLDVMVRRERDVAINASHKLRTPVTALRLDLEDLSLWPQTPPEVARELNRSLSELDRLSDAITHLLDESRSHRLQGATHLDATALLAERLQQLQSVAAQDGRELRHRAGPEAWVWLPQDALTQAVDALVLQAWSTLPGNVTVEATDVGTHVRVLAVPDPQAPPASAGPAAPMRATSVKTGSPAALEELAGAIGGRVVTEPDGRAGIALLLPKDLPPGVTGVQG